VLSTLDLEDDAEIPGMGLIGAIAKWDSTHWYLLILIASLFCVPEYDGLRSLPETGWNIFSLGGKSCLLVARDLLS